MCHGCQCSSLPALRLCFSPGQNHLQQVLYYVRDHKHLEPLWFSNIANQIMWFTYVKAFWRGLVSAFGTKITFKTTMKGSGL